MKIYLINLDRSPERLRFFAEQASTRGIIFERISAVDGRLLSPEMLRNSVARQYEFQPINAGEIGVFMSHRLAWRQLIECEAPCAAVFEDDAVLSEAIRSTLESIEQQTMRFDVIKLETTLRRIVCSAPRARIASGEELCELHTWHGGAAGYVISRSAAEMLLQQTEKLADQVDQILFNPLSKISSQLNIFQLVPAACVQRDILHQCEGDAFGTTIGRNLSGGRIFRHGPLIDLRRLFMKQRERLRRKRLARKKDNIQLRIPFGTSDASDNLATPSPADSHLNPGIATRRAS